MTKKVIAVTQRVDINQAYAERRDALDQRWAGFLEACGLVLLPVPNMGVTVSGWLDRMAPGGFVLSGGNDLTAVGGDAPERDATEAAVVTWATQKTIPLIGVCRGMQFLAHQAGGKLEKREGHVATRHVLSGDLAAREVNSFHTWTVPETPTSWTALAQCADGTIEAMKHSRLPHIGIMWHPEREAIFHAEDLRLFREHFGN